MLPQWHRRTGWAVEAHGNRAGNGNCYTRHYWPARKSKPYIRFFLKSGSWKTETLPQGYKYPVNGRTRFRTSPRPSSVRRPWRPATSLDCQVPLGLPFSLSLSCSHRSQTESGIYKRTALLAWQKLWQRYSQLESINKYIRNFCLETHLHKEDWS